MKIASLFVALGFDIKGDQDLARVERGLGKAEGSALGLLAGVTALNAGFAVMVASAAQAAVSLGKFVLSTGLSSNELQRWQYAARRFNVNGDEIEGTIRSIQRAQAELKLTGSNVAPWQFFGLSVNQNPYEVMQRLHEQFQTMRPEFAAMMASQLGISDNVFQFMRRADLELQSFNANLLLTLSEQQKLEAMNKSWQGVAASITAIKNRFSANFAPQIKTVIDTLKLGVDWLARFVDWLGRGSPAAVIIRAHILAFAGALALLSVALAFVAAALGVVIGAVKLLTIAALPILIPLTALLALFASLALGIGVLVFMIQDFWVACKGGQSAFNWNAGVVMTIKNVERLARAMEWYINLVEKGQNLLRAVLPDNPFKGAFGSADNIARPATRSSSQNVTQTAAINVQVDGAQSPEATGRAAGKSIKQSVLEAFAQMPATQY